MGKSKGRVCLFYQIDFDAEDELYFAKERDAKSIGNDEELFAAVDYLLQTVGSTRVEIALKRIRSSTNAGICPKSFPRTELTSNLLELLNLCLGGENGMQLVHLPYAGTILDQPNIFLQAFYIYCDEVSKFIKESMPKQKKNEADR